MVWEKLTFKMTPKIERKRIWSINLEGKILKAAKRKQILPEIRKNKHSWAYKLKLKAMKYVSNK